MARKGLYADGTNGDKKDPDFDDDQDDDQDDDEGDYDEQ